MKNNFLIAIISLFLFSCKKNNSVNETISTVERMNSISNYTTLNPLMIYNYFNKEANASVYIEDQYGFSNQDFSQARAHCVFKKDGIKTLPSYINDVQLKPFNTVTFEQTLDKADQDKLKMAFGSTSQIEINYNENGKNHSFKYDLPVTQRLQLPLQDISSFYPGKTILWTPSPLQQPGGMQKRDPDDKSEYMLISIAYDPDAPANAVSNGPRGGVSRTTYSNIILNDAGTYTLTADDLKAFPAGVSLQVDMFRGNLSLTEDTNGKKFLLGSYTDVLFNTKNR